MLALAKNLFTHRDLCMSLVRREVSARYRQSLLGPAWALLQPLALLAVFVGVQSFVHLPSEGLPFPLFVYAGLVPWTFFSGTLALMMPSVVSNAAIVKKIYFPREVLPLSSALVGLFDFALAFVTLLLLMFKYGAAPSASAAYLPLVVFVELVFLVGIGLLASAVCAFQRDVLFVAVFALQLWMYASPILYPLSSVPPNYRTLYLLNPMAGIVELFRASLLGTHPFDFHVFGLVSAESLITLFVGYSVFKSLEKYFADAV